MYGGWMMHSEIGRVCCGFPWRTTKTCNGCRPIADCIRRLPRIYADGRRRSLYSRRHRRVFFCVVLYSIALFFNQIYSTVFFLSYSFPKREVVAFEQAVTGAIPALDLLSHAKKQRITTNYVFFQCYHNRHYSPCRYIRSVVLYAHIHFKMRICLTL